MLASDMTIFHALKEFTAEEEFTEAMCGGMVSHSTFDILCLPVQQLCNINGLDQTVSVRTSHGIVLKPCGCL